MNKNDKQIFDMLEKELKGNVENVNIPLRLQKESIVQMLKNADTKETDKSVKSDNENSQKATVISLRNNNMMLRKAAAIAAMLAIVVTGTLIMKPSDGINVVRADSFYKEYKDESPLKNVKSLKEFEQVIEEIRNDNKPKKEEQAVNQTAQPEKPQANPEVTAAQNEQIKNDDVTSAIGSYSEFIASAKLESTIGKKNDDLSATAPKEPVGIATYGDFKADIVKADGKYLYIATNGTNSETGDKIEQIRIVKTANDGSMEDVSTIVLFEGSAVNTYDECIEIYLRNNRLTAIVKRHNYSFSQNGEMSDNVSTLAIYYDITNPNAPVKIREHIQDGEYISSNLYEGKLCLVTAKTISDSSQKNEGFAIPSFIVDGVKVNLSENDIRYARNDPDNSCLFVTVTDVDDFTKGVGRFALIGTGNEVYCTPSAIICAREFVSVEQDKNGERSTMTEGYRINIVGSSVECAGWYRLKGSLIGGVSVDEKSGHLRAVASDGSTNRLYVLDDKMNFVIALEIFNGEKLTRVNFIGNNCYLMVEGEEGEKTVIIDCSNPSSPKKAGEISEKAFSDALYSVSDTQLLGISDLHIETVVEENGEDTVIVPITMTLFDVSDPANPATASVYPFDSSFKSVAAADSRSVMIDTEKEVLGIPVMITDRATGTNSSSYVIFDMSGGELVPLGTYTHSTIGDAAVRSICIGDILYTVSGDKISAFNMSKNAPADSKLAEFPLN